MNLRSELNAADAERFDDRIEPIRLQIQAVVNALNAFILTTTEIPEPKNIYDDLYEEYLRPQQLVDIEDLNEVMEQLAQLVHAQHDVVDSIEEHIERAHLDVHSAHRDLKKAQAAQTAKYPLVAAAVGGAALGGPVGIAAGSTVAGIFAALGGLYGGRYFRRKVRETATQNDTS
ncbi:unnamed protein product [Gongylonema pulchrum]|uniref:t-SNARE coiled-coil homology domain-containing protein n=1 Tax=Gongylonema pulchrum TaxID=637853 RepID=A0A183EHH7_9BILA|nr:unnamed protein product [Gongylonema pulchrum]